MLGKDKICTIRERKPMIGGFEEDDIACIFGIQQETSLREMNHSQKELQK